MAEELDVAPSQGEARSLSEVVDEVARFEGSMQEFLDQLLAIQCHLAAAEAAAIVRSGGSEGPELVAVRPRSGEQPPQWVKRIREEVPTVLQEGAPRNVPLPRGDELYGQGAGNNAVLVPLKANEQVWAVGAYLIPTGDPRVLARSRERLELTTNLLDLYRFRHALRQRSADLERMQGATEVLTAVNERDRMRAAAMAFCNEVATRWGAERVSFGVLEGRYVKLIAMSHTEKIVRKMKLVQDVESAMEECLDQDTEVFHPAPAEASHVSRAAATLANDHGPAAVASFPLREEGEPVGVLTVERDPESPFTQEDLETLRLIGELCTPRLMELHRRDRWIGAKAAAGVRKSLAWLVGPEHTWIKATAVAVLAAVLFLVLAKGPYYATADFTVETVGRRVVAAPFRGFLRSVSVEPGDEVQKGQMLARLDDFSLRMELASARAEVVEYRKKRARAQDEGKTAEAAIAAAQAEKARARVDLLEYRLAHTTLEAPRAGVVLKGDLEDQIGKPVKKGETLFEIGPLDRLRAELKVPEDQIASLEVGDEGQLAAKASPGDYVPFVVKRITPVAKVKDQKNIFTVRVRFRETEGHPWLRPGASGKAKVHVGEASYAWIWTRELVDWLRMKLWI